MKGPVVPGALQTQREATGMVARLRRRFDTKNAFFRVPARAPERAIAEPGKKHGLNARLAELLLINRLKARISRRPHAADILERAARVVFVTCKNWFSAPNGRLPQRRNPL